MDAQHPRRRRSTTVRLSAAAALVALALSGCTAEVQRGWLPGYEDGQQVTNMTERLTSLWTGSWIAALIVGAITWGLILWCVAVYRKRKDDEVLPVQVRYHVPLEVMYVVLPIFMVGVFFYFTARDLSEVEDVSQEPDIVVEVYGKQWSWDFNYVDDDVWDTGVHVIDIGAPGNPDTLPTLYLPVDERVEFQLRSRDVIHSFWVPAFLYKKDMFPGNHVNVFQVVPTREGVYAGKCAELCGQHHAGMLFNVAVVSREEYDAHIESLRERGQTGQLGPELDRLQTPGDDNTAGEGGA
ncbi:aa3-type cytochrome oxidase subunit II [Cellulomonas bogoriensis]|uniref:cytochrome-c oxidase n=2 Tax=Cellulomonas bogoriensis TaxID=301388 RepID=A0A0A0BYF0_9CELL|nr:cytochrome c oxidase subunit II [Cellulomonas bogoriensis]KGM12956.1 cytochrome C oxidase subunit II [Cellulomonas bogoriensis 69B4 = DSM 16987]